MHVDKRMRKGSMDERKCKLNALNIENLWPDRHVSIGSLCRDVFTFMLLQTLERKTD